MAGRHRAQSVGLLLAVVLVATGCSSSGVPMAPSPVEPTPSVTPSGWPSSRPPLQTMPPLPGEGSPAEVSPERWQAILDDLAARGVTGSPTLVSAEAVTWSDSSLGCPTPGTSYTQALVDGMRVVVSVDEKPYDYRFGSGTQAKLCERPR